jgi:carboxymethylenebutenolidase
MYAWEAAAFPEEREEIMTTDFKGYLTEEFIEDYLEGLRSRRQTLKLLAGVTGSMAAADGLLAACAPPPEQRQLPGNVVPPGAESTPQFAWPSRPALTASPASSSPKPPLSDIEALEASLPARETRIGAYLARPSGEAARRAVLICHENRGLTEHIRDITLRMASAGYVALAVDLLSRQGGSAALDPSEIPGILGNTAPEQFVDDFISGWRWLQAQPYVLGDGVGMVGFCFGGGVTWRVAIGLADVRAAVPFYGPHPDPAEVGAIQAAVLAIYAGKDERINQGIPAIEAAIAAAGKTYERVIYPGVDHAFNNDTGPRYSAEAAADAWERTLEWLGRYLGQPKIQRQSKL